MDRKPFQTLARIVQTLAVGKAVELPFAPGARGFEWSETFFVGPDRINGGDAVLHGNSSRKGGDVTEHRPEVTDWTLDDMLQQIVEWDDETFAHVEGSLLPLEDPGHTVEAIADLQDGPGVAVIAGRRWRRTDDAIRIETNDSGKWSLNEAVDAVRKGR